MKIKLSVMLAALSAVAAMSARAGDDPSVEGAVFTMNNSSNANAVLMFNRAADGALSFAGQFPTGGSGTGASLGSQGGVILGEGHQWLFAVNAGSHEISTFAVSAEGLTLVDKVDSGGLDPISLTVSGNLLYVLNSGGNLGGTDNITGFVLSPHGKLRPLAHSTQGLSAAATGPAQVGLSSDGTVLVVTEKNTSLIDTFVVDDDGLPADQKIFKSPGTEPFGFAFDKRNHLFVTEAPGSAVSSYSVLDDGVLDLISRSVPDDQSAACWMAINKNGRFGYAANAASNSASGFRIDHNGSISLLTPGGLTAATGTGPNDMAFSEDSRFLFTLNASAGSISVFRVDSNGSLAPRTAAGVPVGSDGMAAY